MSERILVDSPESTPEKVVKIGSIVTICYLNPGDEAVEDNGDDIETIRLDLEHVPGDATSVSIHSDIGKIIRNRTAGDVQSFITEKGVQITIKILTVE